MTLYHVWCEYDVGFNLDDNNGVYSSRENLEVTLNKADWVSVALVNWQEAEDVGILSIREIEA